MKVLVSLINYNSKNYLLKSLSDIFAQKTEHQFNVVVLDNASPDNSADEIKKAFPKIKLIKHDKNVGFGGGHQIVIDQYMEGYDGLLLVNPDTRFDENTFEKLFSFAEKEKSAGIVSGKILKEDKTLDSNGGNFPFGLALFSWMFNLEMFGVKENFHRSDKEYYQNSREVDWVGGTFMLIKKEVIEKIGLFDKDYFMYFEDVEFCYRAKQNGFKVMITPEVQIEHASGGSSDNPRYFQWSNEFKNLLLFYRKNFGVVSSILLKVLLYKVILLRMIMFGILGRFRVARTYYRVLFSL